MTKQYEVSVDSTEILKYIENKKNNEEFQILTDITAVDYIQQYECFEVVYIMTSITKNIRLIIKAKLMQNKSIESLCDLYPCASWLEREIYDMFGIKFHGHPDLKRILTEYDFEHHPLRKDFPLTGYHEVHYNINAEKITRRPVRLPIEYRDLNSQSPWKGSTYDEDKNVDSD
ncbi:MAG: NADH-quinone oxidoreductase subunit C [Candidatus Xenolissoclinum pacificiensis L6]|uniref:NADH-quinone oxidoreductase subunit C n=1 Tax=Candidatus Xenolissoclinum pacificiensis L6 TaxID=1401685 RepID=W2UZA0_9RICK|nr:MAG: NADH-quinone oxidoreductase subunit C [Candidatus Xenolissoclinum pacificiensis L6]